MFRRTSNNFGRLGSSESRTCLSFKIANLSKKYRRNDYCSLLVRTPI
ncbi:unnamed protein product [Meloidogyne enterolobii]|uniref:Uncharacterized protein n=1 Tax=Meloidogyne enterolobii TaxID=390850 RepID=A0ACB0ZEP9_MELEN